MGTPTSRPPLRGLQAGDGVIADDVTPKDISAIKQGQDTDVVITAFNRREQDPLRGRVAYIPADSTVDELTGEPYFGAQIDLTDAGSTLP